MLRLLFLFESISFMILSVRLDDSVKASCFIVTIAIDLSSIRLIPSNVL